MIELIYFSYSVWFYNLSEWILNACELKWFLFSFFHVHGAGYDSGSGGGGSGNDNMIIQEDTIFVSGMSSQTSEDDISNHFGAIGLIKVCK